MAQTFQFKIKSKLSAPWQEKVFEFLQDLDAFAGRWEAGKNYLGMHLQVALSDGVGYDTLVKQFDLMDDWIATPGNKISQPMADNRLALMLHLALRYGVAALLAETSEDALDYLLLGTKVLAHASGVVWAADEHIVLSEFSRKGAIALHAEDQLSKADILKWYAENQSKFRSIDAAARAALTIAPISFPTARRWIYQYRKSAL
jgi:hypothetical protein